MHLPTRKISKYRTQRKSTDAIVNDIIRVFSEMGIDKGEFKILSDYSQNWFGLEFKLFYPDKQHFMLIRRISQIQDRTMDNAAAIYEWLHNRWMGVLKGIETLEEAFIGMHLVMSESYLPDMTMQKLQAGGMCDFSRMIEGVK